jgi:hypothetical protein
MPPDISALAGNGHSDRIRAQAICGTNRSNPVAWPACQSERGSSDSDLENVASPVSRSRVDGRRLPQWSARAASTDARPAESASARGTSVSGGPHSAPSAQMIDLAGRPGALPTWWARAARRRVTICLSGSPHSPAAVAPRWATRGSDPPRTATANPIPVTAATAPKTAALAARTDARCGGRRMWSGSTRSRTRW